MAEIFVSSIALARAAHSVQEVANAVEAASNSLKRAIESDTAGSGSSVVGKALHSFGTVWELGLMNVALETESLAKSLQKSSDDYNSVESANIDMLKKAEES